MTYTLYFDIKVLSFLDPEKLFIPDIKNFSFKYHCDNIEIYINAMYCIISLWMFTSFPSSPACLYVKLCNFLSHFL